MNLHVARRVVDFVIGVKRRELQGLRDLTVPPPLGERYLGFDDVDFGRAAAVGYVWAGVVFAFACAGRQLLPGQAKCQRVKRKESVAILVRTG